MVRVVIEMDDEMHRQIKVKAAQENRTIKDVATELFKKWIIWGVRVSARGPRLKQ